MSVLSRRVCVFDHESHDVDVRVSGNDEVFLAIVDKVGVSSSLRAQSAGKEDGRSIVERTKRGRIVASREVLEDVGTIVSVRGR